MTDLTIQNIKLADSRAYKNNTKLHNKDQVAKIRESIRKFGFINPVLLNENLEIIYHEQKPTIFINIVERYSAFGKQETAFYGG